MNNGGGSCPSDWEFDGANGDFGSSMSLDEMVFPSPPVEPNDPIKDKVSLSRDLNLELLLTSLSSRILTRLPFWMKPQVIS